MSHKNLCRTGQAEYKFSLPFVWTAETLETPRAAVFLPAQNKVTVIISRDYLFHVLLDDVNLLTNA